MNIQNLQRSGLWRSGMMLAAIGLASALAAAGQQDRGILVLTSTNNPSGNDVVVFELNTEGTPSLKHGQHVADRRQRRREHERGNSAVSERSRGGSELRVKHRHPTGAGRQFHRHRPNDQPGAGLRETRFRSVHQGTSFSWSEPLARRLMPGPAAKWMGLW